MSSLDHRLADVFTLKARLKTFDLLLIDCLQPGYPEMYVLVDIVKTSRNVHDVYVLFGQIEMERQVDPSSNYFEQGH